MVAEAGALLVFCAAGETGLIMQFGQYGYVADMALVTSYALEARSRG